VGDVDGVDGVGAPRAAVVGLIGFAAAEEEMLLLAGGSPGTVEVWGAVPLLAHIAEFKAQQCERIRAVLAGRIPPAFEETDHTSAAVYSAYAARPAGDVLGDLRVATVGLADGMRTLADADLLDPSRHPWLHGRLLWLQVVVRGFWHPTGHIADYYLRHGQPERAIALQSHAVATARYLSAPDQATGMACYGLACAQAVGGDLEAAARTLAAAIGLNPDLRVNAARDGDLGVLRDSGLLSGALLQVAGAGALAAERVVRVDELTVGQRQAATADAAGEAVPEVLQLADPVVEVGAPPRGQPCPVGGSGIPVGRQPVERLLDAGERDADALGGADERHPAQHRALVAPLVPGGAAGGDQAAFLIKVQRGDRDAAAGRQLARGELAR
jgi:hypothetical protein